MGFRCLIVDDSEMFLEAARSILGRDGFEVVATATSIATALAAADERRPDIVLVDIGLGEESGFELTRLLVDAHPYLRRNVVLISTRAEEDYAELIAESPAIGFLAKAHLSAKALNALLGETG